MPHHSTSGGQRDAFPEQAPQNIKDGDQNGRSQDIVQKKIAQIGIAKDRGKRPDTGNQNQYCPHQRPEWLCRATGPPLWILGVVWRVILKRIVGNSTVLGLCFDLRYGPQTAL